MKTMSLEQAEKINGGCIEYGFAWADATWNWFKAETASGQAFHSARAMVYADLWAQCSPII